MMKYIVKSLSTSKTMDFLKNKSYISVSYTHLTLPTT